MKRVAVLTMAMLMLAGCSVHVIDDERFEKELSKAVVQYIITSNNLILAAERGNKDKVVELLQAGADPNARMGEGEGRSALEAARKNGHEDIARVLINWGAIE